MTGSSGPLLERTDLIEGLRALVVELHRRGTGARVRVVGGAAVALTVQADRAATVAIDAPSEPADVVRAAAAAIADARNWRRDWINEAAAVFVPAGYGGRAASWQVVHDDGLVRIEVASVETLLAMKLHAANRRGNRDAADLAVLLPAVGVVDVRGAAELYEDYYPGDSLTARTEQLVSRLLANPSPTSLPPQVPSLGVQIPREGDAGRD